MQAATVPLACFLSLIRPPGIQFENALLQIAPVNKGKCPYVRDNNDVVFQLYTRHNPTAAHSLLIDDDEALFASSIDFHDQTVVYFHAFMETPDDGSALIVRQAFTHRGDTNVIVVDAQRLEAGPWYFKAAQNTWYIGRIAAQFIDYLVSRGLQLSKTHLVGHSLGAQAAGVTGASLQSGVVSRITGLDPALPLFDKLPEAQRLDPSDAEFVDAIHTDAGIFGFKQQVGHVDFYPNGGISPQPGCELEVVLPKHLVLNKCMNDTKPNHTLVFHLQEKSTADLQERANRVTITTSNSNGTENIRNEDTPKAKLTIPTQHKLMLAICERPQRKENISEKLTDNTNEKSQITENIIQTHINYVKPTNSKTEITLKRSELNHHRQKRFVQFFKRPQNNNNNILLQILQFLMKNHQRIIPTISIIREISTIVNTRNGEIQNVIKEQNNIIGGNEGTVPPITTTYNFDVANDSKIITVLKKLLGIGNRNKLIISSS